MVAAIAGRLRRMGLPTDAVVGVQLPNIVENILTMLGVLRAGMIAAPLPLLWRRADAVAALAARRRQGADHLRPRRRFQSRPVRHARGGGSVFHPLCLRFRREPARRRRAVRRFVHGRQARPDPAARARAGRPMPRRTLRRSPSTSAKTASCRWRAIIPNCSPAGLACCSKADWRRTPTSSRRWRPPRSPALSLTLLPWLLSGGMLLLHHPFDADVLARQRRDDRCPTADSARSGRVPAGRGRRVRGRGPNRGDRRMARAGRARHEPDVARSATPP